MLLLILESKGEGGKHWCERHPGLASCMCPDPEGMESTASLFTGHSNQPHHPSRAPLLFLYVWHSTHLDVNLAYPVTWLCNLAEVTLCSSRPRCQEYSEMILALSWNQNTNTTKYKEEQISPFLYFYQIF